MITDLSNLKEAGRIALKLVLKMKVSKQRKRLFVFAVVLYVFKLQNKDLTRGDLKETKSPLDKPIFHSIIYSN